MIYVCGPGHGGPTVVANTYLEVTYSEVYPDISRDEAGLQMLFRQFSFPGGIPSHASLNAMNRRFKARVPWALTFSFGRAIQQPALDIWRGDPANVQAAQRALQHRAACNRLARRGEYMPAMDGVA